MLHKIYEVLAARLREITALKEVVFYVEQDGNNEIEIFTVPVAFILFEPIKLVTLPNKLQMVGNNINFKVKLVTENFEDTEAAILENIDLANEIYIKLQGYNYLDTATNTQIINSICRTSLDVPEKLTNLIKTTQNFEAIAFDLSAIPVKTKKKMTLKILVK